MPKEYDETKQLEAMSKKIKNAAIATTSLNFRPLPNGGGRSMADLIAEEDKKLDIQYGNLGKPLLISVDLIDESPYQTNRLNEEKVIELSNNLATNPLSSPIAIRRKGSLRFELIAGRHRLAAYKRLQRTEIEATIRELDDEQAEKLVFYDNLFGPDLSDYEKYLGFAQRKKKKNLTQTELAQEAGVTQGLISRLMCFDGLPEEVSLVMQEHPKTIGVLHAPDFVKLSKEKSALAIQAIKKIAAGEFTQKAAIAWIKNDGAEKPPAEDDSLDQSIKSGAKTYAKMSLKKNRMAITFTSSDEGLELWSAIEEVLRIRASKLKTIDKDSGG